MKYTEEIVKNAAKQAYLNGEVKFDIRASDCALVVIDMQDEFVKLGWTSSWIPEATRQVPKIKRLIDVCRSKSIPVYIQRLKILTCLRIGPKQAI